MRAPHGILFLQGQVDELRQRIAELEAKNAALAEIRPERIAQLEAVVEAGKRLAHTTRARDVHPNIDLAREEFFKALAALDQKEPQR